MGASQPFMYAAVQRDPRFHEKPFDPKAVTRASRNPTPRKPQPSGPLISFNQHPDTHAVFRSNAASLPTLGPHTRLLIKWLRRLQLAIRIIQLIAAVGVLFLFSIFKNVDDLTTWAVRIMQIVAIANCAYAIFSLARTVTARTAASQSAYQFFSVGLDFTSTIAYVLGVIVTRAKSSDWETVLSNQGAMSKLVDAVYYTMIAGSGLHFLILPLSAWLGWIFRSISLLPPDASPLEDLVKSSRPPHKRNKSSMSAVSHDDESSKRPWTQTDSRRNSTQQSPQARTVAFMDTRYKPPPLNLPERQYQIHTGRPSVELGSPTKSIYHRSFAGSSYKGAYTGVPGAEADSSPSRSEAYDCEGRPTENYAEPRTSTGSPRSKQAHSKTTSIADGRTRHQTRGSKSYAALTQHDDPDSDYSDYEGDRELGHTHRPMSFHPNPLRSNPTSPDQTGGAVKQALRPNMPHMALEYRDIYAGDDDGGHGARGSGPQEPEQPQRVSSIQPEEFFSVSNSQTLGPIPIDTARKVSGNDYASRYSAMPHDRQNASGKNSRETFSSDRCP